MTILKLSYIYNLIPYIQIDHQHLYINPLYAPMISKEFLHGILVECQVENLSEGLTEAIWTYLQSRNVEENVTVVFDVGLSGLEWREVGYRKDN